ncbi:MAG TPA: tRNA uridine-5-carboxymethylaminomethyl(34) synthesis GTPase MnmE [Armatimonadota bacterium]|jgi:tRNA modification GTPase
MSEDVVDTIAAISTPLGAGGIGIVRLSGPVAIAIADQIFRRPDKSALTSPQSFRQHYGFIIDPRSGAVIDEVLLCVMRGPHSYTRDDVVEICAHGGAVPLRAILELALASGARLAMPGEFTQRAFLNGRIDLTQAEAVLDTISARTTAGLRAAQRHLHGEIGMQVRALRQRLIALLASLEAAIDYAEDGLTFLTQAEIQEAITAIQAQLSDLIASHHQGRLLRDGAVTAIIGRPNTGKSSLLNALVGESRAIVTHIPGTTRDILEEQLEIAGVPLRLLDTAGIRQTDDFVEMIGVERSRASLAQADLILLVLDRSMPLTADDTSLFAVLHDRPVIVILNKADLPARVQADEMGYLGNAPVVHLSALTGDGMKDLVQAMQTLLLGGGIASESPMLANLRQRQAAERAASFLALSLATLADGGSEELLAVDLMAAADALADLTGEQLRDDVIGELFARFCVGK